MNTADIAAASRDQQAEERENRPIEPEWWNNEVEKAARSITVYDLPEYIGNHAVQLDAAIVAGNPLMVGMVLLEARRAYAERLAGLQHGVPEECMRKAS